MSYARRSTNTSSSTRKAADFKGKAVLIDRSIGANTINSKQQQETANQAARALLRDQAQDLRRLKAAHPVELTGELRVVRNTLFYDTRLVQIIEKQFPTYYSSVTAVAKSRLACVFINMLPLGPSIYIHRFYTYCRTNRCLCFGTE